MITAELPDGQTAEFPDDATPEEIQAAVQSQFGGNVPPPIPSAPLADPPAPGMTVPEAIVEEAPQTVGGIATGLAAGAAGVTGLVPLAGAVALGGGAGEAFKQMGQHLSGSLDAPKTSLESAKRIGEAALTEGGFELVGGLVTKGFGKVLAPFKKTVIEGIEDAAATFKDKISPVLLPSEMTENRVLDILHNVSEASLIGGNQISNFKTKRLKFFDDFADSMIDQFGKRTDPEDLGNLFVSSLENSRKAHTSASNVLYNNVSDLIGTKTVKKQVEKEVATGMLNADGTPMMKSVMETIEVSESPINIPTKALKDFTSKSRVLSEELGSIEAKNAGDDLVDAVNALPDTLTFDAARELRSRLISRVDEFSVLNKKAPAIGKAKKLISILDAKIGSALKKSEIPEALDAWRTANKFYKTGQKKYNNTMLRRLVKLGEDTGTGAENIAPSVFKPGQISRVRRVKTALGQGSDEWRQMKGFFMQHLMNKSTDVNGQIVGKRLLNNLSGKPNSFGDKFMGEVLTPPQLRELRHFGKVLQAAQQSQAEGTGRMLIQLSQGAAVGGLLTGNLEGPAAAVIFAPPVIAKMMLNPITARLLSTGISTPANSAKAMGILSRLTAASERIHQHTQGE